MNDETKHILFLNEDNQFLEENLCDSLHSLYLFNAEYQTNLFDIIPKKFTISTSNDSFYFNIDMLKDTSSVIAEFVENNSDSLHYHLNINDEGNVFKKIEQIYQGKIAIFDKNDYPIYDQIKKSLNLINFPDLTENKLMENNFSSIAISKKSFFDFISKSSFTSFTIITKRREYECNSFGILSSKVIYNFIMQNPNENYYIYDFDDDFSEFQLICDFFNCKKVDITPDNMYTFEQIANDLQITIIIDDIAKFIENHAKFIENHDKLIKKIDEHQETIDSINELFYYLFNIKSLSVLKVKFFLIESGWCSTIEKVQELAAFIIQVIKTDFLLHHLIFDLLIELDSEGEKMNNLKILVPFIVEKLMKSFKENNCSFIYILWKKGFISNEQIFNKLPTFMIRICQKEFNNVFDCFFPFIIEQRQYFNFYQYDSIREKFFSQYYPNRINKYKEMLDSGEPDNEITKIIRNDDIESFQTIVIKNNINIFKSFIPYNIYEDFVKKEKINYLNYAAAYGSIKIFKFLLLNHIEIDKLTFKYAIYGGNVEIIRIVNQNVNVILNYKDLIIPSIKKHRNDLFDWILNDKIKMNEETNRLFDDLILISVQNGNAHSLFELIIKKNYVFDFRKIIQESVENGFYSLSKLIFDILFENTNLSSICNSFILYGNLSIFKLFEKFINQDNFNLLLKSSINLNIKNIVEYIFDNLLIKKFEFQNDIEEILKIAVSKNEKDIFFYLINEFQKINSQIFNTILWDKNILPIACKNDNFEIVEKIVEIILKNDTNEKHVTMSFLKAAEINSMKILRYLTSEPLLIIDYEYLSSSSDKLHSINLETFSLIIDKSPAKLKDSFYKNFIYPAINKKNFELVEFILKQNADFEDALIEATCTCSNKMVELILKYNCSDKVINRISPKGTPLCIAARNGSDSIVKLLSLHNIDPSLCNSENQTPLQIAIKYWNIEAVIAILDLYDDNIINHKSELDNLIQITLEKSINIYYEMRNKFEEALCRILDIKNINPNLIYKNTSFLIYACDNNREHICEKLLSLDSIDPNIRVPYDGKTPLIISISKNKQIFNTINISMLLINHPKIDLYIKDNNGKNAIDAAIYYNRIEIIKVLADKGIPDAMNAYGNILRKGKGIDVDAKEACRYYKMAIDKGHANAMNNYGIMLFNGTGIALNKQEAAKYYKMAADNGNEYGMINYASMLIEGIDIPSDLNEAIKYLKMAVDLGNANAINFYGLLLEKGKGVEANKKEAAKYYKMAADKGDDDAMVNYGTILLTGNGIEKNIDESEKYLKMAADKGNPLGINNYGFLLLTKSTKKEDFEEVCRYYKKAADLNVLIAMTNYGYMLDNGLGVPVNHEEASKYYKTVIEKGGVESIFRLAEILKKGICVEKNEKEAERYYKIASDAGYTNTVEYFS